MDIEYFFQEWDKDKEDNDLAELLEDNVRVMNTIEAEDSEDESGIILKRGCKNMKTHAVAKSLQKLQSQIV